MRHDAGFLKGFLSAAVFVLIIFLVLPARYETNDDFALIRKLSPQSGFRPDPYHHSLSYTSGRLLCFLYKQCPQFPWYGSFIYSAAFLGTSLMLSVLFRSTQGGAMLLSLPPLCLFFLHIFSFISFTAASLILEFAIFVCAMEWVVRDECPAGNAGWYGLTLALGFLMCFLLRWRLVLFSTVLGAPILLFVKKHQITRAVLVIMALGAVVVADRALFRYTSSDEYRTFMQYSRLRAQFNDTVRGQYHGELTDKALTKVGWSINDYAFYRHWILYDNTLFNAQTLGAFLTENDPKKGGAMFALSLERLKKQLSTTNHYTLALIFSIVSILVYRFDRFLRLSKKGRFKTVLALAVIGTGIVYIMSFRFVPRVYVPLYAYFVGATFLLFDSDNEGSPDRVNTRLRQYVIVPCAVIFSLLSWGQAYAQGKTDIHILEKSKMKKAYIQRRLDAVKRTSAAPDSLLILMNPMDGLGEQYVHPLKEFSDFTDLRIFPAGWGVNSPRYDAILTDMGLKDGRAFLKWMMNNQEALLVLMAKGRKDIQRWKYLWGSYFFRRIAPTQNVSLIPVHDFTDKNGVGLVFFNIRSDELAKSPKPSGLEKGPGQR